MVKNLIQFVADLFATAKPGEDLSSRIQRLRDEMIKAFESEDAVFGKFRGLLESFREIIPDEQQRYHAALKALSTTAKLSRQEIVKAVSDQLEELKIVEKGIIASLPGRDELKALEKKAQEVRSEITKLREATARLENEEKTVLASLAAREKEGGLVEKTITEIFANVGAEMEAVRKKMGESPAESAPAQPVPTREPVKNEAPAGKKGGGEQKSEPQAPPAPVDPKFQRKCPMCGGQFNLLELDNLWQCYNCAYEEPTAGAPQGKSGPGDEPPPAPPEQAFDPPESFVEPLASMAGDFEEPERKSTPSGSQQIKKKPCPACKRKMFWYPEENAWRCSDCGYETRGLR